MPHSRFQSLQNTSSTRDMKQAVDATVLQFAFLLFFSIPSWAIQAQSPHRDFVQCLLRESENSTAFSQVIYTPQDSSYSPILNFLIQNLRYITSHIPKPQMIITPVNESQIKTAIRCSKKYGLQMRIRSGVHDFEGRSYVSEVPFFILDLFNFRSISIDAATRTAWVGAGATIGELYYAIDQLNSSLAFPAGYCPTVCLGGHVSGGGYGPLVRKYGLAADNVIDARVIDVHERTLDRESMGEDFFWAIRGGVGASFGVVLSYKLQLVEVPKNVTAFIVKRTLEQNATELVYKWQSIAHKFPTDILISVQLIRVVSNQTNSSTIQAGFHAAFQGDIDSLLLLMEEYFPELGVSKDDCVVINWVQYYAFYLELPIESTAQILQSRIPPFPKTYFKAKSDFVQDPIPIPGLEDIWELFSEDDGVSGQMVWTALGGRMDEIPESEIPFPHRAGNSFVIYKTGESVTWVQKLHRYMGQYVANNPRGAYANYPDLDLGVNNMSNPTVDQARVWGAAYFKGNFDKLVTVKTAVDRENFFNNEQSIPPLTTY